MRLTRGVLAALAAAGLSLCALGAAAGSGLLYFAYRMQQHRHAFVSSAQRTSGRVVKLRKESNTGEGTSFSFFPTVEFTTGDGRAWQFESRAGVREDQGHAGEIVAVLYDPRDPAHAEIEWAANTRQPLFGILSIAGTIFVAVLGAAAAIVAGWWSLRARAPS